MPIRRDIPFQIDPEEAVKVIGRGRPLPRLREEVDEALKDLARLWRPAAIWDYFPLLAVEGETVRLRADAKGREATLSLGSKADLLAPAELVQVSVATIGPEVDERVRQLGATGEALSAFVLDSLGVLALWLVGQAVRREAEAEAVRRGWGVGRGLSPGSLVGWPLTDQPALCSLLNLAQIGVELTESCLLIPLKSTSTAIGLVRDTRPPRWARSVAGANTNPPAGGPGPTGKSD